MSEHTQPGPGRSVVEVEFTLHSTEYLFVSASKAEGCRFELAKMVPRNDGRYAEFFNVTGTSPERILDYVSGHDTVAVSLLREYEDGGLFEFLVSGGCPARTLAGLGALPREIQGVDGEGRIVAEIPPQHDPPTVIETFLEECPDAELTSKRSKANVRPLFTQSAFEHVLSARLTDRQREVLEAAFEAGYYEWPRECTGADLAAALGISSATFSEHIHAAERKLLAAMFGDRC